MFCFGRVEPCVERLGTKSFKFPPEVAFQLYSFHWLQPHFDYCSVVWGNCGKTLSSKLQKLQNRAARILTYSM